MGDGKRRRLRGCAIGCGALVLLPVLALGIVSVRTCVPLGSAGRSLAELEARFGPPESFTPPIDGSIPPERVEAFLEVRAAMIATCGEFRVMWEQMRGVSEMEDTPSAGELAANTWAALRIATGLTPLLGELFERRNTALLDVGMGLGEYDYVYAVAYGGAFADGSIDAQWFSSDGTAVSPQVQAVLRGMLARQLDGAVEAGVPEAKLARLRDEVLAMERDPRRLPWQGELPAAIEASLLPQRERLDAVFCEPTAGVDMDREPRRSLQIALD